MRAGYCGRVQKMLSSAGSKKRHALSQAKHHKRRTARGLRIGSSGIIRPRLPADKPSQVEKARDAVQAQVSETLSLLKGQHDLIMQQPVGAVLYEKLTAALNSVTVDTKEGNVHVTAESICAGAT